jgi:hypothetical protein
MGNTPVKQHETKTTEFNSPGMNSEHPSLNSSFNRNSAKKKSYKSQRSFNIPDFNPEMRLFHKDELEEEIYDTGSSRLIYPPVKQVVGLRLVMHLSTHAHLLILKEERVSQIEIDFDSYFPIYDTIFLLFRLESLYYLTLKFSDPVNANQFRQGLECIARMSLKLLKLQFINSKSVTHLSFNKLSEINANFEFVTGFSIEFFNCPNLTDNCLPYIQSILFTMTDIIKFEFTIMDCQKITEKGLTAFSQGISQFKKLKEFKFVCSDIRGLGNKFAETLNENIKNMTNLSDFNLKIPGYSKKFHDKSYRLFCEAIEKFVLLRNLTLDFSYSQIDKAVIDIKTLLRKLKPLDKLSLHLNRCSEMSGDSLEELFTGLNKQNKISDFELSLRDCKALHPDNSKFLQEAISTMGNLQELNLDFSECPEFGDRALKYITEGLKNLQFLSNLQIHLRNCNRISDLGFYYLCFALEETTKIKKLSFSIQGMTLLTNLSMEYLSEGLRYLPDLDSLSLNLLDMTNVSEEGYKMLSTCLEEISTVKTLMLTAQLSSPNVARALISLATCSIPLRELDLILITAKKEDYSVNDDDLIFFIEKARPMVHLKRIYMSVDRFKAGKVGSRSIQDALYRVTECTVDCNILKDPFANVLS